MRAVGVRREIAIEPIGNFGESGVGAVIDGPQQEVGLPETTKREERAVAEQRGQQPGAMRIVCERVHRRGETGVVDLRGALAPAREAERREPDIGGRGQALNIERR